LIINELTIFSVNPKNAWLKMSRNRETTAKIKEAALTKFYSSQAKSNQLLTLKKMPPSG